MDPKQKPTSIHQHVPGSQPEPDSVNSDQPDQPVTTFDRNNPPTPSGISHTNPKKKNSPHRDFINLVIVLGGALLTALLLIAFVFQSYQVDGPSMQSTLQTGDHLIVWKVPKTIAKLTHHAYIPNRGDIIVFTEPDMSACGISSGKQLIKRVIGLPGERVVYKGTQVTVYNQSHPNGFNPDTTLPYGSLLINNNPSNVDVTVGKGQLFVSGDHRDNSCDSRAFGPIDDQDVIGKLAVRILPLNTFKAF